MSGSHERYLQDGIVAEHAHEKKMRLGGREGVSVGHGYSGFNRLYSHSEEPWTWLDVAFAVGALAAPGGIVYIAIKYFQNK